MPHDTEPRFSTRIPAYGPYGNLFEIVGNVRRLARKIGLPQNEIDAFSARVMAARSYTDALAVVREWFPVDMDED